MLCTLLRPASEKQKILFSRAVIGLLERARGTGRVATMASDGRDLLEVLRAELKFIELGGYDLSNRSFPKAIFQDSLTCINFGLTARSHSCERCHLFGFVDLEHRSQNVPCHFIRLTEFGETIADLMPSATDARIKHAVKSWLRWQIRQIEFEQDNSCLI